ncbi:MAG: hypothetical protein KDE51_14150 [Anaerolineales bacterium]|nr:hypothetical protein [Anaerolineales bacterium]
MAVAILTRPQQMSSAFALDLVQQYAKYEIADVLEATHPYLVYGEVGMCWRVPLTLKNPITHNDESVDHIDVEVHTGHVHVDEEKAQQLRLKAYNLFKAHLLYKNQLM